MAETEASSRSSAETAEAAAAQLAALQYVLPRLSWKELLAVHQVLVVNMRYIRSSEIFGILICYRLEFQHLFVRTPRHSFAK